MKIREYKFKKDKISLFRCQNMKEIERDVEKIFKSNEKILPLNKNAKILIKPNLNNDLNAITGNSTDLRIIVSVLKSLKKRGYKNIILADGPNCGINHVGIDVLKRLGIKKIGKIFNVIVKNLNYDKSKVIKLGFSTVEVSKNCLDADFIINLPKIKTHKEAGITVACKNYMGCFKGVEKRKIHNNLPANIVKMNEIIKTNLIIADGLICMEGNGPGDGIPKNVGIILSGHNPFIMDFLVSKLIGLDYKRIRFLMIARKKGYITKEDEVRLKKIKPITQFIPAKKNIFDYLLLNNFFIYKIRFNPFFEKFFNKGPIPWLLFKLRVRQDVYIHKEMQINKLFSKEGCDKEEKKKIKNCLEIFCPMKCKSPGDEGCIRCMYCYQILPSLIRYNGDLGAFKMQLDRFGKYIRW